MKKIFSKFSVDDIVLNIDLAPTFLDMADIPTPQHMDGRSILPLLKNRHRSIRGKWPDTFLIESSGRRETPEQLQEQRVRALAAMNADNLLENSVEKNNDSNIESGLKNDTLQLHFNSHEDLEVLEGDADIDGEQYSNSFLRLTYKTKHVMHTNDYSYAQMMKFLIPKRKNLQMMRCQMMVLKQQKLIES